MGELIGTVPDWVSALSNVGVAVAAICAAVQGVRSLTAWRTETQGRRRMELAEDVLADVYEARAVFQWVRSPASFGYESEARPGREADPEAIRRHRDTFFVPLKRLNDNAEFFSKARARRYRVVAAFGPGADKPYELMHEISVNISVSAEALMRLDPTNQNDAVVRRQQKLEADVWQGYDEKNQISEKIEEMMNTAELLFRKEIDASS